MSYEEGCSASSGYEMDTSYGCDASESYYNPPDSPAVCTSSYGYDNSSDSPGVWTTSHEHYNDYSTGSGYSYSGHGECRSAKNIFLILFTIGVFITLIALLIWTHAT